MLATHAPPLHLLLTGAIDYAGLFPPAALGMAEAVQEYQQCRTGPDRWALGRFVVPATRLPELAVVARATGAVPLSLAVLAGDDIPAALKSVHQYHGAEGGHAAAVEAIECRAADAPAAATAAGLITPRFACWVEIPLDRPTGPILDALKQAGAFPKIRTGGTTPGAFPEPGQLVAFLQEAAARQVPFKATAGLHHLVRGQYRLTYAGDSACGFMYGYLNLFLATALLASGSSASEARELLLEERTAAFAVLGSGLRWRDRVFDLDALHRLRRTGLCSFGSCSFREPLDELSLLAAP